MSLQGEGIGTMEAMRTYVEFADGTHRGMYDPETGRKGFPDEDYDATTAMVINWHGQPEANPNHQARLEYRREHPTSTEWMVANGESRPFWHRAERVNRVILTGLEPNSVYAYRVRDEGVLYRFRTMPSSLEEREVTLVITGDHQQPNWTTTAHNNAKLAAALKPDMFIVKGDFVNCEGNVSTTSASRWALYLDTLYHTETGYFLYDVEIDGTVFPNMVIPHIGILGNHETGDQHHIRWPSCVATGSSSPGFPQFTAANWMELLFHFPYRSEGFFSEFRPGHPNLNASRAQDGFGHGGFGKLSFSDYLLLIGLDNSQNWEGEPDQGLRDWRGDLITDTWPWFETHHADVRQDLWLKNLLEPEDGPTAGERYENIIPFWHRGVFGASRPQMTLKNRGIMEYWLPILYRNGVKYFGEAHDHAYLHTVPMGISTEQPAGTYIENVGYTPNSWSLRSDLPQSYLDDFFTVQCLKDETTNEIVGWAYKGHYITHDPHGMRAFGHGGWAGGRSSLGARGAGNAGWWFADENQGGKIVTGSGSFGMKVLRLRPGAMVSEFIPVSELSRVQNGEEPQRLHHLEWNHTSQEWLEVKAPLPPPTPGMVLEFDRHGSGDEVELPYSPVLDLGNGNWTIEFWHKFLANGDFTRIVRTGADHMDAVNIIDNRGGRSIFMIVEGDDYFRDGSSSDLDLGTWYHVAITWDVDADTTTLYLNGEPAVAQVGLRPIQMAQSPILFHNRNRSNKRLAHMRFWNHARDQEAIKRDMLVKLTGQEDGLTGYWMMNEGAGHLAVDSTANRNHGAITGGIWVEDPIGMAEPRNNGVPHSWLRLHEYDPHTVDVENTLAANQMNNLIEAYVAGLNPRDPTSIFRIEEVKPTKDGVRIRFKAASDRWYRIWHSDSLVDAEWNQIVIHSDALNEDFTTWIDDDDISGRRFFIMEVSESGF